MQTHAPAMLSSVQVVSTEHYPSSVTAGSSWGGEDNEASPQLCNKASPLLLLTLMLDSLQWRLCAL